MPITTPKQQMTEMTYIKTSKEPTKKHTMPKERSSPPTLVAPWIRRQQMIHSLWHFFGSKFPYTSSFRKLIWNFAWCFNLTKSILGRLQYAIVLTYLWTYEHKPCWKLPAGFSFCLRSIQEVSNSDTVTSSQSTKFFDNGSGQMTCRKMENAIKNPNIILYGITQVVHQTGNLPKQRSCYEELGKWRDHPINCGVFQLCFFPSLHNL